MPAIHVIRENDPKLPRIELIDRVTNLYRSGCWALSAQKAQTLIGGKIYFHRGQSKPAFFGGTITAFELITEGEYASRVIFTLSAEEACRGFRTPKEGWSQEMKFED